MTSLYLVRHGEAVVNVEPIIGGMQGDTGLTPRGVQQAESLRDRLRATRELAPDVFVSSTLPRARQTAELLAPAFDNTDTPLQFDDDLQEIRVGEADGMTHETAFTKFGNPAFEHNPYRPLAPGGESWSEFMLRVGRTIHRIIHEHEGKTIVAVTHGGFIDGSFAYFLNLNTRGPIRLEFYPHNTSLTHWAHYTCYNRTLWRLVCYNDTAHLQHIGMQESPRWANVDTGAGTTPDPETH